MGWDGIGATRFIMISVFVSAKDVKDHNLLMYKKLTSRILMGSYLSGLAILFSGMAFFSSAYFALCYFVTSWIDAWVTLAWPSDGARMLMNG